MGTKQETNAIPQASTALCASLYHRVGNSSALSEAVLALFSFYHTATEKCQVLAEDALCLTCSYNVSLEIFPECNRAFDLAF